MDREKQPLKYRVQTTATTLTMLCAWFDIWRVNTAPKTRKANIGTINQYASFFRFTTEACRRSIITAIPTLFERPPKDRVTLGSLLQEVSMGEERRRRLVAILSKANTIAGKVQKVRHTLIAHRSGRHTFDDAYAEADSTPDEIMRVITLSCVVFNRIADAADCQRFQRVDWQRPTQCEYSTT